jgi:hypothetical protein
MGKCITCGKWVSDANQEHRCLVPLSIIDKSGKVLVTVKGNSYHSSVSRALKIAGLWKQRKVIGRPVAVNVLVNL